MTLRKERGILDTTGSVIKYHEDFYNDVFFLSDSDSAIDFFSQENISLALFYHFISSPNSYYEKKFPNRIPQDFRNLSSQKRLENILLQREIQGNPKGLFIDKLPKQFQNYPKSLCAVSFSLYDYHEIPRACEQRESKYAIVFKHEFLNRCAIRQVQFVKTQEGFQKLKPYQKLLLAKYFPYLLDGNDEFNWENEWRVPRRVRFTPSDIAFIIVPDRVFLEQKQEENTNYPFLNPYNLLPISLFTNSVRFVNHLRTGALPSSNVAKQYSLPKITIKHYDSPQVQKVISALQKAILFEYYANQGETFDGTILDNLIKSEQEGWNNKQANCDLIQPNLEFRKILRGMRRRLLEQLQ